MWNWQEQEHKQHGAHGSHHLGRADHAGGADQDAAAADGAVGHGEEDGDPGQHVRAAQMSGALPLQEVRQA